MQTIKDSLKTIIVSLTTLFLIGVAYAWTEPSSNPQSSNVSAPINTSETTQYKSGALGVGGLLRAYSNLQVDGNITSGGESVITSLSAGTGISISGSGNSRTITNTSGSIGSGITNYISKWTSGSALGNSLIFDNGTGVGIGTTAAPMAKLEVNGNIIASAPIASNHVATKGYVDALDMTKYIVTTRIKGIGGSGCITLFGSYYPSSYCPSGWTVVSYWNDQSTLQYIETLGNNKYFDCYTQTLCSKL